MKENNQRNSRVKGVLLAIASMVAPVALAAADDDLWGGMFWKILCYAIAGGLASTLAGHRSSSGKKRKNSSKVLILVGAAGVLFFVFAYSIHAIAEKFKIDFFWDETARCALAASAMTALVMVPIAVFSVKRSRRGMGRNEGEG